ncbi:MAG: tRNA lysidine(34) synthetase TilS [Opitutales bacterium]
MTDAFDWRAKAKALAQELDFPGAIEQALPPDAPPPGLWPRPWIVACSGGADSTALLLCLAGQFPKAAVGRQITVAHFNHQTRGAESDADAIFVQAMAEGLGLPCRVGLWQDYAQHTHRPAAQASEQLLRIGRERFFSDLEPDNAPCLRFMGHQRDDVAETLLIAVSRGSHPSGMATAPLPWSRAQGGQRIIVRPLLSRSRAAIEQALSKLAIPWREDTSNQTDRHLRNRLRHQVIPPWVAAADRDPMAGAAQFRQSLQRLSQSHSYLIGSVLENLVDETEAFDFCKVEGWPWAAKHELLATWLERQSEGRFFPETDTIDAILKAGTRRDPFTCTVAPGVHVVVQDGLAKVVALDAAPDDGPLPWPALLLKPDTEVRNAAGCQVAAEAFDIDSTFREAIMAGQYSNVVCVFLDEGECRAMAVEGEFGFQLRGWHTGDRYRPLNAPGSATLQDLFVNHKIPARERRRLPVVCVGGHIVWVPGLPPAHALRIRPESRRALRLTYQAP